MSTVWSTLRYWELLAASPLDGLPLTLEDEEARALAGTVLHAARRGLLEQLREELPSSAECAGQHRSTPMRKSPGGGTEAGIGHIL